MTQFEHNLMGLVVYGIIWNLFIKKYFYDEDEHRSLLKFWNKFFNHNR